MLDQSVFNKAMAVMMDLKEIKLDPDKSRMLYCLLKNDFDDAEFNRICGDICRTETLFGKYPDPKLFYDRKPRLSQKEQVFIASNNFVAKVSSYLSRGYVPESERIDFLEGLTETEARILRKYGGISRLYEDIHRDSHPRSLSTVLRDIQDDFEMIYQVDCKTSGLVLSFRGDEEMKAKVSEMIKKTIKVIGKKEEDK